MCIRDRSMTDIVMSNSSKISDCSFTSPVLMNSFRRSFVSTKAIRFCSTCLLYTSLLGPVGQTVRCLDVVVVDVSLYLAGFSGESLEVRFHQPDKD